MSKKKQTYNPCDDCQYSYSKNGQESRMCEICEFTYFKDLKQSGGEWKLIHSQGFSYAKCTKCEKEYPMPPHWTIGDVVRYRHFCPNCGAKMKCGE